MAYKNIWRVEYAKRHHVTGDWLPEQTTWVNEEHIRRLEAELRESPDVDCIKVTGPHRQEVPDQ